MRSFRFSPSWTACGIPVPDAPGLGVEIDLDVAREIPVSHSENPHTVRPDGSVTNF